MRAKGTNSPARQKRPGRGGLAWIVAEMAIGFFLCGAGMAGADGPEGPPSTRPDLVRIGIAPGTWGGVNRDDAQAAIKAWTKTIMRQRAIPLEVETTLYESETEITAALKGAGVDAVSMLSSQFLALEPELRPGSVFLSSRKGRFTEQYVLLARRYHDLAQEAVPQERKLLLQNNVRASLAPAWLDTMLAGGGLESGTAALKSMRRVETSSKAVLQVFFRQADACVVTANVFEMAGELNPQISRELRVLAVSPEVVPAVFFFRPGCTFRLKDALEAAIVELHESVAGQQVLTLFQGDGMLKRPVACLEQTRQLLEDYRRLNPSHGNTREKPALSESARNENH